MKIDELKIALFIKIGPNRSEASTYRYIFGQPLPFPRMRLTCELELDGERRAFEE